MCLLTHQVDSKEDICIISKNSIKDLQIRKKGKKSLFTIYGHNWSDSELFKLVSYISYFQWQMHIFYHKR